MSKLWTVFLVFVAIVVWQVAAPYYTVYQIKQAVEQQDAVKLAKYVDFIQLQQNLKYQLQAKLKARLEQQNGSFFGMLAIATTEKALDSVLEQTVNPSTILLYFKGKRPFQERLKALNVWSEQQESAENISVTASDVSYSHRVESTPLNSEASSVAPRSLVSEVSEYDNSVADAEYSISGKELSDISSAMSSKAAPYKNWTGRFNNLSKFTVLQQRENGTEIRYLITRSGMGWQLSNIILSSD